MKRFREGLFLFLFFVGIGILFYKKVVIPFCNEVLLLEKGRQAKARVYDISCGTDSPCSSLYAFVVDSMLHEGNFLTNDFPYDRGDTVEILYLVSDPNVNGLVDDVSRKSIRDMKGFLGKSAFLHHVFLEKDTI